MRSRSYIWWIKLKKIRKGILERTLEKHGFHLDLEEKGYYSFYRELSSRIVPKASADLPKDVASEVRDILIKATESLMKVANSDLFDGMNYGLERSWQGQRSTDQSRVPVGPFYHLT